MNRFTWDKGQVTVLDEAEVRSAFLAVTKASTPQYILDELDGADEDGDQFEEELETYGDELQSAILEPAAKTGSQWLMEQAVNLTALGIVAQTFWQPKLKATASDRARAYVDPDEWPEDLPPFGGGAQPGLGPRRGELTLRFNQLDARAGEWASRHSAQLVSHIQNSEKDRIAELISRANTQGLDVGTVARQLRWVGLLPQHQTAVARYQLELAAEGRPMAQVLRMADKYKRSLLNYRTRMIARHELLTATHEGQLQAILDAVQHGEIDPSRTQRVWVVADDERLCPICEYMDGQETPADEPWTLEDGTQVMIPQEAHIQCRCSWQLVTTPREDDVEAASWLVPIQKYDESQHPRDEQGRWTDGGGANLDQHDPTRLNVYHGTIDTIKKDILKHGLKSNYGNGRVWIAKSKAVASRYAQLGAKFNRSHGIPGQIPIMVHISIPKIVFQSQFKKELDGYYAHISIPPEWIRGIKTDKIKGLLDQEDIEMWVPILIADPQEDADQSEAEEES
jgi:hypothetical protein